jgi:hypothetical protein
LLSFLFSFAYRISVAMAGETRKEIGGIALGVISLFHIFLGIPIFFRHSRATRVELGNDIVEDGCVALPRKS